MRIKRLGWRFAAICLATSCASSACAEVLVNQDFRTVIHTAGASVWPAVSGNSKSGTLNNAFNGVRYSTSSTERWLSSFKDYGVFGDEGKDGVYAQMRAPDAFLGRIYLKKYRFYLLSNGGNEAARAPKAWKVFGVPAGAKSSADWTELDAQSGYTDWVKPTEETTNEFEIASAKIAGSGFRAFRFVPLDSKARTWSQTNPDFGLMEIEFEVDVYRNVTVATDLADPVKQKGDYSPALGTSFDGVTTLTAPSLMLKDGTVYACAGHRVDTFQDGRWVKGAAVEDDQNSFSYTPAEDPNEVRRVVWLWRESDYDTVDWGEEDFHQYVADRGVELGNYAYGQNTASTTPPKRLFDGLTHADSNAYTNRWLGYTEAAGGCHTGVKNLPTSVLAEGDLFYVKNYTLYMLNLGGKERLRAPTAWTLSGATTSGGTHEAIDARTGFTWPDTVTLENNGYSFTPAHPEVGFADLRFTPTASSVENPTEETITVGLMELSANVKVANRPGTLRVHLGRNLGGTGFSHADGVLVTETATVSAPEAVVGPSGSISYSVAGYRLEKFNRTTLAWDLVEESSARTYAFDASVTDGYRLTWLASRTGTAVPWTLTTNASDEPCIRNSNWEFAVTNEADGTLKIIDKGYRAGSGELDLSVPVQDASGNPKAISIVGSRVINGEQDESVRNLLTSLVLPTTVWKIAIRPFRNMTALKKVVMRCPELTTLGECTFTRDTALEELVIDAPKLTAFNSGYTFYYAPLTKTDASAWNLSSLVTLPVDAFRGATEGQVAHSCGALTLPALQTVGATAFLNRTSFAELRLGTAEAKLAAIGDKAFKGMAITNLVLGAKRTLAVGAEVCANVNGGAGVGALTFLAHAPADRAAVDRLLEGHGPANLAHLTVSKDYPAWSGYVTATSDISDVSVKAAAEAAGADGAWANAKGEYLALVFRVATGFRPSGLSIFIR